MSEDGDIHRIEHLQNSQKRPGSFDGDTYQTYKISRAMIDGDFENFDLVFNPVPPNKELDFDVDLKIILTTDNVFFQNLE